MGCFQILVVSFVFVFFISLNSEAASPEFRSQYCPNTTLFTQNSTYHSNRNLLFASLNSNATRESGFYNATVGRGPDTVFGSFLCRGDLAPDDCRNCVGTATNDVARDRCPRGKEAIVWYDQCMLRYSNENFFGIMIEAPGYMLYNRGNINDPNRFSRLLGDVMDDSIKSAVDGDRRFGTKEANYSVLQTLYSLVQCTPDLSGSDCNRCLRVAAANLPVCCAGSQGANILYPSCNIRYEVYPFYNTTAGSPLATLTPPTLPPLPPPLASRRNGGKISPAAVVSICVAIAAVLLMSIGFCYWLKRRRGRDVKDEYNAVHNDQNAADEITTVESLQYDFSTIQTATNNFSDDNKLGEGGFGTVYMGKLSNGQEIAVKRLSSTSLQGSAEFKNEVILVAKLQHRNLTRLLGFCLEREEKILIYEFVPNKSLDKLLFDQLNDQETLDWTRRFKIIGGIARGILYLHEDSRLRIIHRDLKASNILLDEQMNPKISDFGMAKICGVDQTRGSTSRIVGTFGYMSPEYAFYGQFSVKSDVFSFGVLIIEIVTGKKCTTFQGSDSETEDLLSFAWKNWRNGTALEIIDQRLGDSYTANEVMRCIHIGLLCVQEDPVERPTMATIVLMLSSFSVSLPLPKKPAFFPHTRTEEIKPEQDKSKSSSPSVNEMSITETYPR